MSNTPADQNGQLSESSALAPNAMNRDMVAVSKMVAPLLVLMFVAAYFYHFVISAILSNIEINGLIIVTIFYGTMLILSRFINAQRDFQIIERFGAEAIAGRPMQEIAEEPWIRQRYVRHYFKHVAAMETGAGAEVNRHAIESELHALNDEYNSKLELPQFLVGFMIALGLLGTFIGLLETLTGISSMLDGIGGNGGGAAMDAQFMKLVGELKKPLAGMGIAFSASMFGLIGSLVLAIMMINLRRYVARVILCARNVMHDIIEIKQISFEHGYAAPQGSGFGGGSSYGQADTVERHRDLDAPARPAREPDAGIAPAAGVAAYSSQVESAVMLLAGRMDVLTGKLESLARAMEAGANATSKLNDQLSFGPKMKEVGQLTYEQLRAMAEGQIQSRDDTARRFNVILEKLSAVDTSSIASEQYLCDIRDAISKVANAAGAQEIQAAASGQQTLLIEALLNETRQTRQWLAQLYAAGRE